MKWIRTHESRLHDRRFATLSAEAERAYNRMYILAGILEADGLFLENDKPLPVEDIAYRTRLDVTSLKRAITELQRAKLVHVNGKGPQLVDYVTEQIDLTKRRAQINERVTRYRELHQDGNEVKRDATHLERETQTQIKTKTLSLLKGPEREALEKHPAWIQEAIDLAISKGKDHSPAYITGILRNWLTEGRPEKQQKGLTRATTAKPVTAKPQTPNPAPTPADRAAAARIAARLKSK